MAHSAHCAADRLHEIIEPVDVVRDKVRQIASLWRSSRCTVVVTGAGMSTACGIKDYRSGTDTCLPTGPGVWTQAKAEADAAKASAAAGPETSAPSTAKPPAPKTGRRSHKRKSCSGTIPATDSCTVLPSAESVPPGIHEYDEQLEQSMLSAVPSYGHLALVELHRAGKLHQLITMNTDSLHEMSGLPASALVEIHGNQTVEQCVSCNRVYRRDGAVQSASAVKQGLAHYSAAECARMHLRHLLRVEPLHPRWEFVDVGAELTPDSESDAALNRSDHFNGAYTGRFCTVPSCRGKLVDNVIEFERALYDDDYARCSKAFKKADLIVILGSSSVVDPVRKWIYSNLFKKVVQINLQATDIDQHASVSLHCKIDDAFRLLMVEMTQCRPVVQPFILRRFVRIEQRYTPLDAVDLCVTGVTGPEEDAGTIVLFRDSLPVKSSCRSLRSSPGAHTTFTSDDLLESDRAVDEVTGCHSLYLRLQPPTLGDGQARPRIQGQQLHLRLQFMGHKKEPDVDLCVDVMPNKSALVELCFDTGAGSWAPLPQRLVWTPLAPSSSTRRSAARSVASRYGD